MSLTRRLLRAAKRHEPVSYGEEGTMELSLSPEAIALAQRRGGVMALDFIPPLT